MTGAQRGEPATGHLAPALAAVITDTIERMRRGQTCGLPHPENGRPCVLHLRDHAKHKTALSERWETSQ